MHCDRLKPKHVQSGLIFIKVSGRNMADRNFKKVIATSCSVFYLRVFYRENLGF